MYDRLLPRPTAARAARILSEVFGGIPGPFAFRLWDGTMVLLGSERPAATAVIKSPETFAKLMRDPSPGNFAEAYVSSEIDLEGDLSATMAVANAVESIRLTRGQKLRLYLSMWRS